MNNKIMIFSLGVAVGAVASWFVAKEKYRKIADDEIASVKEVFQRKKKEDAELAEENKTYCGLVDAYDTESADDDDVEENKDDSNLDYCPPYIIHPDDYGQDTDNEVTVLMWYGNDILTDTYGLNVDDIDNTVGREFIDHFGENSEEPDVVYVRNNRLEMDYQILQCNSGEED